MTFSNNGNGIGLVCINASGTTLSTCNIPKPHSPCCSSNGQYVFVTTNNGGGVYYSSNYGSSFAQSNITGGSCAGINCDTTGQYVYAASQGVGIYFSSNFGVTYTLILNFNTIISNADCQTIACDKTGTIVTTGIFNGNNQGGVYQTINGKIASPTWSAIGTSTAFNPSAGQYNYWLSVACDKNTGQKIVMGTATAASYFYNGGVYTYNGYS
jgi:hypothetical protein